MGESYGAINKLLTKLLNRYLKTGTAKYKTAADTLRLQLQTHTRNKEGKYISK
jgi:rhamnogalacturonyl hydrolase YesR